MKKSGWHLVNIIMLGVALLLFALPIMAQQQAQTIEPVVAVAPVRWFETLTEIEDTEAVLTRMEHGLAMTLDTSGLQPGNAYTAWWVIFNLPDNCSDNSCGLDDVLLMDDHNNFILDGNGNRQLNRTNIEAAQIFSMWAGNNIVDENGTIHFEGHLPIGDMTGDVWFGHGLFNTMSSVVHIVTRDHGPVIPGLVDEQLFTMTGGCQSRINATGCSNNQVAIFEAPE